MKSGGPFQLTEVRSASAAGLSANIPNWLFEYRTRFGAPKTALTAINAHLSPKSAFQTIDPAHAPACDRRANYELPNSAAPSARIQRLLNPQLATFPASFGEG